MKLFYMPSACSLAPHILSRELNMTIDLIPVPRSDKTELLKFNPKGHVPTLVLDNGQPLTEVAVILQYMADQKPDSQLVPRAGTWERYKTQEWLNYIATELHKNFNPLFKFKAKMGTEDLDLFRQSIHNEAQFLDTHFASNSYLLGNTFSIADIYAYVVLHWSQWVNVDLTRYKNLLGFMERVQNRPTVRASHEAESAKH